MAPPEQKFNKRPAKLAGHRGKDKNLSDLKSGKLRMQLTEHRHRTVKKVQGVSGERAMCRASSLGPTRVVIPIEYASLVTYLGFIARLMSYEIQSRGSLPRFSSVPESEWNPSKLLAYLLAIYGMKFGKIGVLDVSSSFRGMGSYVIPTFVAKHLQQIMPSQHMDREVSLQVSATTDDFLNEDCGTGGLVASGAQLGAPCAIDVPNDSEPWFQYTDGGSAITPGTLSVTDYSKLSAVISRVFKHTVKVAEVPDKAVTNELKICPVATSANSQLVYCCLDDKTMCDLILPLASFNTNVLVNSPNPLQSAAPVRVDGSASMCPEAKISFLFWLANKQPFKKEDSFLTYIRKFGIGERNLANIQINLRQINWTSVLNIIVNYAKALTSLDASGFWYFVNYAVGVIHANIPGCFRAFTPIAGDFNISRQDKDLTSVPGYCSPFRNPKMPPFLANIIKGLRTPIRSGNQITFFYNQMPDSGTTFPWWTVVATNAAGTFPDNYGSKPINIEQCGMGWGGGPYKPYPLFTAGSPPASSYRNYVTIKGSAVIIGYLQQNLQQSGATQQNLYNQWSDKVVNFTKRHGRFYLPCNLAPLQDVYPSPGVGFTTRVPVPQLVSSWEPTGYATAILAASNMITYYMPSDNKKPLLPTFSTVPGAGVEDSVATGILCASPGQGSQQAMQIAQASNPADVQAHLAADGNSGIISDHAIVPEDASVKDKIDKHVHSLINTGVEEGEKIVKGAVKDGAKAITKGAGKLLQVLV